MTTDQILYFSAAFSALCAFCFFLGRLSLTPKLKALKKEHEENLTKQLAVAASSELKKLQLIEERAEKLHKGQICSLEQQIKSLLEEKEELEQQLKIERGRVTTEFRLSRQLEEHREEIISLKKDRDELKKISRRAELRASKEFALAQEMEELRAENISIREQRDKVRSLYKQMKKSYNRRNKEIYELRSESESKELRRQNANLCHVANRHATRINVLNNVIARMFEECEIYFDGDELTRETIEEWMQEAKQSLGQEAA